MSNNKQDYNNSYSAKFCIKEESKSGLQKERVETVCNQTLVSAQKPKILFTTAYNAVLGAVGSAIGLGLFEVAAASIVAKKLKIPAVKDFRIPLSITIAILAGSAGAKGYESYHSAHQI